MEAFTRFAIAVVASHTAVGIVHGVAHGAIEVFPSVADSAFIAAVVFVGPILGAAFRVGGRSRVGDPVLLASFLGSLLYGLSFHFLLPGPDDALGVPAGGWSAVFLATASALALIEAFGAAAAAAVILRGPRNPSEGPVRRPRSGTGRAATGPASRAGRGT